MIGIVGILTDRGQDRPDGLHWHNPEDRLKPFNDLEPSSLWAGILDEAASKGFSVVAFGGFVRFRRAGDGNEGDFIDIEGGVAMAHEFLRGVS